MKVVKLSLENFEEEVLKSDKPVLVDFNAEWCGPCKMLAPIIEEIAEENDTYKICSLNVDEARDLAYTYEINSIPCLIIFKDGQEMSRSVGFMTKEELKELLG